MESFLTGIKSSGEPHLGNYVSVIRPVEQIAKDNHVKCFIADGHAITQYIDPYLFKEYNEKVAATWLTVDNVTVYRQSKIPQIFELFWILSCFTPKGFMNRSHSYLSRVEENRFEGKSPDHNIFMGLFNYPILMAADILLFQTTKVPIGRDQKQHLEIARDLAKKVNYYYDKEIFVVPEPVYINTHTMVGLDGQKMSKSYNNTIPLFCDADTLKKKLFSIVTNSKGEGERKYPNESDVIEIFQSFTNGSYNSIINEMLYEGRGWGEIKYFIFEVINKELEGKRQRYKYFLENKKVLYETLQKDEEEMKKIAKENLQKVKDVIGFT